MQKKIIITNKKIKLSSFYLLINIKYIGDNMSKETFKHFAQNHPELAQSVSSGKTTWQALYELYDIYGESSSVWSTYINNETQTTIKDLFSTFKNLDMESVQRGVTNIQKTISLLQDIGLTNKQQNKSQYEPRPLYQYFED